MTTLAPFAAPVYPLRSCTLRTLQSAAEAATLGQLLAGMDPWHTLGYTAPALQRYLWQPETTLYRYAVDVRGQSCGVCCVRYPWLRGAYLELLGLHPAQQGTGVGTEVLAWLEAQAQPEVSNVWVLVSAFNSRARAFYSRQGYHEIGPLRDFVRTGFDEIFLRKVLRP